MRRSYLPFDTDLDVRFPNREPLWEGRGLVFTKVNGDGDTRLMILDERRLRKESVDLAMYEKGGFRDRLIMVLEFGDEAEWNEYSERVLAGVLRVTEHLGQDGGENDGDNLEGGAAVGAFPPNTPSPRSPGSERTFAEATELPRSP